MTYSERMAKSLAKMRLIHATNHARRVTDLAQGFRQATQAKLKQRKLEYKQFLNGRG